LGKRSTVVLNLGLENYEALLERHGQWVRWRTATKCPCAPQETGEPNIHCKRCGGRGIIYGYQAKLTVTETLMVDISGIVEVSEEYADCELDFIYDYKRVIFKNAVKTGRYITLNSETPIVKGTYVYAVMTKETAARVSEAACENEGGGYYRVSGLRSCRDGIDGLYHTAPGDIIKIDKIIDAAGVEYHIKEFRTDLFLLGDPVMPETTEPRENDDPSPAPPTEITEPLTAYGVEYIPPFIFALLNQNLSKQDTETMIQNQGDAVVTFPYNCDVAESDVLTVLSGAVIEKDVVKRVSGTDDTLAAFFVQDVISCIGADREYKQGIDFILTGTNRIRWACEDAPEPHENYSVSYKVNPTYVVIKEIPQLRTSENQRLPKKVVVKWYTSYSEKKGVNLQ
jgi:hypothetical protein